MNSVSNRLVAPVEYRQEAINIIAKVKLKKGRWYERQCAPLRLYAFKPLVEAKRLVTRIDMMEAAEVSLATFSRDIAKLRC